MKSISIFILLISTFTYYCYAAPTNNLLDSLGALSETWSNYNDMLSMALNSPSSSNNEKLSTAGDQLTSAVDKVNQDLATTPMDISLAGIPSAFNRLAILVRITSGIIRRDVHRQVNHLKGEIRLELQRIIEMLKHLKPRMEALHLTNDAEGGLYKLIGPAIADLQRSLGGALGVL